MEAETNINSPTKEDGEEKSGSRKHLERSEHLPLISSPTRDSESSPAGLIPTGKDPSVTGTERDAAIMLSLPTQERSMLETARPIVDHGPDPNPTLVPSHARSAGQCARFKAMFDKHLLEFDDSMMPARPPKQATRVEKRIRMRVRIVCHYCHKVYFGARICMNCHHGKCEKCTRLPSKSTVGKVAGKERVQRMNTTRLMLLPSPASPNLTGDQLDGADAFSGDDTDEEESRQPMRLGATHRKSKRRKEGMQRIRRSCCQCQRLMVRDSTACPDCRHPRCTKCPLTVPRMENWTNDNPEDPTPRGPEVVPLEWKTARFRVRWTCHQCLQVFSEGESECPNCSHVRCLDCSREPHRRERSEPNQEANSLPQQEHLDVGTSSSQDPDLAGILGPIPSPHDSKEGDRPAE